jgi:hypothetical protein
MELGSSWLDHETSKGPKDESSNGTSRGDRARGVSSKSGI